MGNGYATPFEETYSPGNADMGAVKSISIDPSKQITAVSVKADGPWMKGLRLYDENGNYILNSTWYIGNVDNQNFGEWTEPTALPEDMSIIGLRTSKLNKHGIAFSFSLWYPP